MPELPEVETVVRSLAPHIQDCQFLSAKLLRSSTLHPQSLPLESIVGMTIKAVRRRAKLIILDLSPDQPQRNDLPAYLIAHLRMTGRIFTQEANSTQGRHTRCVFGLKKAGGETFSLFFDDTRAFGKILIASQSILENWKFWRELGPEPLTLELADFKNCLYSKRAIKTALLDQKVIAGIGNIYADESLFMAGINPFRPAQNLTSRESAKLLTALKKVLKKSIEQCGSSIRDYRDANGNVGAFQNNFFVYGRCGEKCKKCGSLLVKARIGGRSSIYCPFCQK